MFSFFEIFFDFFPIKELNLHDDDEFRDDDDGDGDDHDVIDRQTNPSWWSLQERGM